MPLVPSAPHANVLSVYHGTFRGDVESIKKEIKQPMRGPGDFHTKHQKAAFYTTPNPKCAELWAKERETDLGIPGFTAAVMHFKADLSGLKVYNFGEETSGERHNLWKKVILVLFLFASYIDVFTQFVAECWAGKADIEETKGCDVIIGYMSTGWASPSVPNGKGYILMKHNCFANFKLYTIEYAPWEWEDENPPLKMQQVVFITEKAIKQLVHEEDRNV
jgi:hypothetical protein